MPDYYITEDNFPLIDPNLLLDMGSYPPIEDIFVGIGLAHDYDKIKTYSILLADKLSLIVTKQDKALTAKYIKLMKLAKLFALSAMTETEKKNFFENDIVEVFSYDFVNVKEEVERVFKNYFDAPDLKEEWRKTFLAGLEKNQELIGTNNISVTLSGEDRPVRPTLQNWLLDFNSNNRSGGAASKGGGYQLVSYITSSANAKILQKSDRDLLLNVVQFYDWLKHDPLTYDFSFPGEGSQTEEYLDVKTPQQYIPDDLIKSIDTFRASKPQASKPVSYITAETLVVPGEVINKKTNQPPSIKVPAPQNLKPLKAFGDVKKPEAGGAGAPAPKEKLTFGQSPNLSPQRSNSFSESNAAKVREILQGSTNNAALFQPGLRLGGGVRTNVPADLPVQPPVIAKPVIQPQPEVKPPVIQPKPQAISPASPVSAPTSTNISAEDSPYIDKKLVDLENRLKKKP